MSSTDNKDYIDKFSADICANCGKGEENNNSLKACTACHMVKYCNRECQIAHRPQHKKECKKRATELHDEKLFKQPPPADDCAICFLRLPHLNTGQTYKVCCGKVICSGCRYAPVYDNQGNKVDNEKQNQCPFCRVVAPKSEEELIERREKRIEAGDPIAIYNRGCRYRDGTDGFPQNHTKALELWHRAAELGDSKAYCSIGVSYDNGEGVEIDKKKAVHYYELSAFMGNATARCNLGLIEKKAGNMNRALRHWVIAARSGDPKSLKCIKTLYTNGHASKEDYTTALQVYQAYLSEIKSRQRDNAAAFSEHYRYY